MSKVCLKHLSFFLHFFGRFDVCEGVIYWVGIVRDRFQQV